MGAGFGYRELSLLDNSRYLVTRYFCRLLHSFVRLYKIRLGFARLGGHVRYHQLNRLLLFKGLTACN